ncbi:2,3-diphosphoglycerate-dependent phosphoglycerate mutase [Collinsella sp. AGMB00827]|uniref:2,3-bisphosphoglycerate-dependent phosphoglycerate mutase n=1 Tax=Collinsella ureilytica TaxID=2869515 RepID=A0ABS7MKI3_9ACTN|nr:2,3-diphosphoglycerate-dependent phosphoglycerate mutase [Collinsella urealyticum]MBY4797881.1 2,3-diphosphoglycerate-dependent phosphoglycerate mutase [Collinsella urealyticum]
MSQDTMQLVIVRHGESEWNKLNLFTGWTDVDLTDTGRAEAAAGGRALKAEGFDFDVCYTSQLKRAIHTLNIILAELDREWLPVIKSWKLNERHYGALQGLNKADAAAEHGNEQVKIWRRSFDVQPPALEAGDERDPHTQEMYRDIPSDELPYTECLKDCIARAWPYFEDNILPEMRAGKRVLIAAHGNSLRSLVMKFEKLTPEEILEVNIPTGVPCVYTFDKNMNVLDKRYIGDADAIAAKIDAVANQGKAK